MGKRSDYKKMGEFSAWDMDKGTRNIVNQKSPGRRRLRDRLRRQERARIREDARKETDESFTETLKRIAEDEYGITVTVTDGPGTDTFESLFGISLEEAKRYAAAQTGEDDIQQRNGGFPHMKRKILSAAALILGALNVGLSVVCLIDAVIDFRNRGEDGA